ncbi:MAG: DUF6159 family protein [Phycisphaerales bacterium JB039]
MFATLSRSWEFAKISYGMLWACKSLVVFPIMSGAAAIVVLASFAAPLWGTGTIEQWMAAFESEAGLSSAQQAAMWVTLFLFYFASYFVIVFFNTALTACAMQFIAGQTPSVSAGLSMASKRLPQILGWAFVSALIGVLLRAIENAHEKAGAIVAMILGSAWTALTFFVVPVIVIEGDGPVGAFKKSAGVLKNTWGTALVGQFSLGFLGMLIAIPVVLVCAGLGFAAWSSGSMTGVVAAIALGAVLLAIVGAVNSAADVVFKAVLYNYATGKSVPQGVDTSSFARAFATKK